MTKQECHVTLNIERLFGATRALKQQKAPNLNWQMCHASREQLHRLLKIDKCNDSELIKLVDQCVES